MRYIRMMGVAVVAALVCYAGGTATAFAEGGPLIGFCHLTAVRNTGNFEDEHCLERGVPGVEPFEEYLLRYPSETLTVLASAINTQILASPALGVTVECTKLKLLPGAYLLGGSPATDLEQILYSGCTVNGHPNCDVYSTGQPLGSIQTEPLESELVYVEKQAAVELNPDISGTLFRPQPPLTEFVAIQKQELTSGACPGGLAAGGTDVTGSVILLNDEPLAHLLLHVLLAFKTPIPAYYLGHTGVEHTVGLKVGGDVAKYLGEVSVDVTLLNSTLNLAWWLCP
jgi:hypothetical protein